MENQKVTEKALVVHGNKVTESIFKYNEFELNIFIALIFKIKDNSEEVVFSAQDIKKFSMMKNRGFSAFEKLILGMQGKSILLRTDDGYESMIPFITLNFILSTKSVRVKIHPDIQPMLKDMKREFTKYRLHEFLSLESRYSKRLFQILKQWESVKKKEFKVDYLKQILDAENYDRFERFETRVLKTAVKDITENTTMKISYEKVKTGRSITGIIFYINCEPKKEIATQNNKPTRANYIKKALISLEVNSVEELTEQQKKIINISLKNMGYKEIK